jgi:hypothetical protein
MFFILNGQHTQKYIFKNKFGLSEKICYINIINKINKGYEKRRNNSSCNRSTNNRQIKRPPSGSNKQTPTTTRRKSSARCPQRRRGEAGTPVNQEGGDRSY